jgi:opacity protein-like surface antigen
MMMRICVRVLLAVVIAIFGVSSLLRAQDKKDFGGWYIGGHSGLNPAGYDVGGYTVLITQTSGINVPTRGIIIVPGTARDIPATSTGGSVDFTVPTCATTASPITYTCTGNRSSSKFTNGFSDPITSPGSRSKGFLGGGQIGYNKQFLHLVIGGEGEFSGSTVNGTSQVFQALPATALTNCVAGSSSVAPPNPCTPTVTTYTREASSHWTSSLRLRTGWIWHRTLIYGTAGPAFADVAVKATDTLFVTLSNGADCPCPPNSGSAQRATGLVNVGPIVGTSRDSHIQFGWTAGVGAEHRIWTRFRFAVEYRHSDLGSDTFSGTTSLVMIPNGPGFQAIGGGMSVPATKVSFVEDRIAARLNFHF